MNIILLLALIIAILIGVWGVACLIGGAVKSGGALNMINNWIKSLSGKR